MKTELYTERIVMKISDASTLSQAVIEAIAVVRESGMETKFDWADGATYTVSPDMVEDFIGNVIANHYYGGGSTANG